MDWNKTQNKDLESQKTKLDKPKIEFKSLKQAKEERGIKVLCYGNFSTGKTHFALTATKPIYILDTENGASPLAEKFPDAKILNISNMTNDNVEEREEVQNFESYQQAVDYLCSLPDEEVGTVIVDSISDIWEWTQAYGKVKVFKLNVEDRLKQMWDWGTLNHIYLFNLKKLINKNCNVILTARENEVFDGPGKPSGRFEPKCQKKTPYWVDVVLYHKMKFINKQLQFQARVDKSRQKGELIGKVYLSPTFEKIKEDLEKK